MAHGPKLLTEDAFNEGIEALPNVLLERGMTVIPCDDIMGMEDFSYLGGCIEYSSSDYQGTRLSDIFRTELFGVIFHGLDFMCYKLGNHVLVAPNHNRDLAENQSLMEVKGTDGRAFPVVIELCQQYWDYQYKITVKCKATKREN